jgi:predicted amidohydrolase
MSVSPALRVAAAQIPVGADLDDNLAVILEALSAAAAAGVALVVFPEAALTGYAPVIGHIRAPAEWPAVQAALAAVARRAGELGLWRRWRRLLGRRRVA